MLASALQAAGYAFNETVPDVRLPESLSGGSACPVPSHQTIASGSIAMRWSTALATNPTTILTQDQTASGRLTEIEQVIQQSLAVWTGVAGTALKPVSLAPLRSSLSFRLIQVECSLGSRRHTERPWSS